MSRMMTGDQILVKPTNNVYTVLAAVGIISLIIAFIRLWMVNQDLSGVTNLFAG